MKKVMLWPQCAANVTTVILSSVQTRRTFLLQGAAGRFTRNHCPPTMFGGKSRVGFHTSQGICRCSEASGWISRELQGLTLTDYRKEN